MKSIRYVIVIIQFLLISVSLFSQEASIVDKYKLLDEQTTLSKDKITWPSTSCFSNWTPTFTKAGGPTDYQFYFSFDGNAVANNTFLNQYLDKYMKVEYYWKNNAGVIIPGYGDEYMLENPLIYYIYSNTNPIYFQCLNNIVPQEGNPFFKMSFYEPDRNDPCASTTLICSEEYSGYLFEPPPSNATFYGEETYKCYNAGSICKFIDRFSATKSGNDLVIGTKNLTNAEFNSVVNAAGFMLEIKGYNGTQIETRTIEVNDITNLDIENWSYLLDGFANFSEYRIKMYILPYDTNQYTSCGESRQLLFNSTTQLCDILSLLQFSKSSTTSLKWDFTNSSNPNYFVNELSGLGYTLAQAQVLYSGITAIDFDLKYKENGIVKSLSIHHVVGQNNIADLNFTFSGLTFDDLIGKLEITYYYNIDGRQECQFLPFEFSKPKPGVGTLKKYECGVTYPQPIPDPANLKELQVNDVVTVNGITFKINTISGSGTGPRSGTGSISLPFSKSNVMISFSNVVADTNYVMISGLVQGVPGDPANYPGFNIPATPLNSNEICLPDPPQENDDDDDGFDDITGLNERGFDSNGIHENGTPYDDRGFNKDGIHANGSPYDECGCDFENKDKDKNPCSPCINEKDIVTYIKENKDKVNRAADSTLQTVISDVTLKLQTLDCSSLKIKVERFATNLGYQSDFVFGKQNIYKEPGLSNNFLSEPVQPVNRLEGKYHLTDSLEVNHIKLYHCDKLSITYNNIITALSIPKAKLEEYINDKMKSLTLHQINSFKEDPLLLSEWIKTILDELAHKNGIGAVDKKEGTSSDLCLIDSKQKHTSAYNASADLEEYSAFIKENKRSEKIWLFNQGYQDIEGVNRGEYLEELYNQMQLTLASGTENDVKLPLVIKKIINGSTYAIYLDNLELGPNTGKLDAYFVFTPQNSTKKIILSATNIGFGPGGLIGNIKLKTLTPIELRLNNAALLRIMPSNNTFVEWDCEGFKSISIDGQIEFCRNTIVPLDEQTFEPLNDSIRYRLDFQVALTDWKQFYLAINPTSPSGSATALKPFAIAGHESIKWTLKDLVVDMSEIISPSNVTLPSGYTSPFYAGGLKPGWTGISLGLLKARLPFKLSTSNTNIEAAVSNLIIDERGVTTKISAINIVSIDNGSIGGWPFSIDTVSIVIINSQLQGGGIAGKVKVPILKNPLVYAATMKGTSNYSFAIKPSVDQKIDMFLADVILEKTSEIKINYENGDYVAKATLNGSMEVNFASTNIKGLSFKNLEISNKSPYFSPGEWGMGANVGLKLFGFGINMKNIKVVKVGDQPALDFVLDLDLIKDLGISASGGISIVGKRNSVNAQENYSYEKTMVNSFNVDVTFAAGHIKGSLKKFDDHPKYGEGFNGSLDFEIKALGKVTAIGQFGRTNFEHTAEYKYMYIDASATLKTGLQAGPITIEGFTGGVSYHMTQVFTPNNNAPPLNQGIPPLGASLSGSLTYNPSHRIGLGLKAGALLSLAKSKAMFNGSIDIAFEFNDSSEGGGLNNIALNGVGRMMNLPTSFNPKFGNTKLDVSKKPGDGETAALSCHLRISYNFDKSELHGQFITFLDAGVIKGAGNDDKMVDAEVHFSSSLWYIYIGKPDSPCGIKLNIPGIGDLSIKAYLDAGTDIPGMPPIPDKVKAIAYTYKEDNTFRKSGSGFIFGASLEFSAKINFGIGSASVEALAGFDVGMMDFKGITCNNKPVGIDGWYAKGQLYAYLKGQLKVFGVDVMSAGFAAIFAARLPNPIYATATAGVEIKVMKWKIKKSFTVELGNKCVFQEAPQQGIGMELLVSLSPDDNAKKLPTDTKIKAEFAVPLDQVFEMPKLNEEGTDKYLAFIKELVLKNKNGTVLGHRIEWDATNTLATIIPDYFFSSNDSIIASIKLNVTKNGIYQGEEIKTLSFTTGESYTTIPVTNVLAAYPSDGMKNFYKKEYNQYNGFIMLNQGVQDLIYSVPDGQAQNIRFTDLATGEKMLVAFEYKPLSRTILFPMDHSKFVNGHDYKLEILRHGDGSYTITPPSSGTHPGLSNKNAGNNLFGVNPGSSNAGENSVPDVVIYSLKFRVSQYDLFKDKIRSAVISGSTYSLAAEKFDKAEIEGYIKYGFSSDDLSKFYDIPVSVRGKNKNESGSEYQNCNTLNVVIDLGPEVKGLQLAEGSYKETLSNTFADYLKKYADKIKDVDFKNKMVVSCKDIGISKVNLLVSGISFINDFDVNTAINNANFFMKYALPDGQTTSTLKIDF